MSTFYGLLIGSYLRRKWGRAVMTLAGITLGVTMVVAVVLTNDAIVGSYQSLLEGMAGRADLQVTAVTGQGFSAAVLDDIKRVDGIAAAVPVVASSTNLFVGDRKQAATIQGIQPELDQQVRSYRFVDGRQIGAHGEVAITKELASTLAIRVGEQMRILSTDGLESFVVVGIFDSSGTVRGALGPFGVVPLADAQVLFGKELDAIDLLLSAGVEPSSARQKVEQVLTGRARVGTPIERSQEMQGLLDAITFSLTMAASVSLLTGWFIIYTNMAMGVVERRRDLAIVRACGARRVEVIGLVLVEAAVMGLVGGILGFGIGYMVASFITQQTTAQFLVTFGLTAARVQPTILHLVLGAGLGMLAALGAAYGPAVETVSVSPVDAMRPADVQATGIEQQGWMRPLAGAVMICIAILFIKFTWPAHGMLSRTMLRSWGLAVIVILIGITSMLPVALAGAHRMLRPTLSLVLKLPGRLAADNLLRQPRRTAATIAALMVSLSFMVGLGGMGVSQKMAFQHWFDKTIGWDLSVSSSFSAMTAQVEMSPTVIRELAAIPGIKLVSPQKYTQIILSDGKPAYLQAEDHRLVRQFSEADLSDGDWTIAADEMEAGGSAMITPAVGRRLGIRMGDQIQVPTPMGVKSFKIVAIMRDVSPWGGTVKIDRQDYVRYWGDESASIAAILVEDKAQVEMIRTAIVNHFDRGLPLQVRSNRDFWNQIGAQLDQLYQLMDGLSWIAIVVAGLALANTLFASTLERRRELGILRALGAQRAEIMKVVLGEALSIGLVGGVIGVISGSLLQALIVRASEFINGVSMDYVVPVLYLSMAVFVSVVVAPLIGVIPARLAARLDVVEAIRYE